MVLGGGNTYSIVLDGGGPYYIVLYGGGPYSGVLHDGGPYFILRFRGSSFADKLFPKCCQQFFYLKIVSLSKRVSLMSIMNQQLISFIVIYHVYCASTVNSHAFTITSLVRNCQSIWGLQACTNFISNVHIQLDTIY